MMLIKQNLFPIFYGMETNQILDRLFFINYQLTLDEVDRYFEKLDFKNFTREPSILSFIDNNSNNSNGISWYMINLDKGKVRNSSFRTTKEISLNTLQDYAQTKYGFEYEEEEDGIIIYKKDKWRLHLRTSSFEISEFSKVMYQITLFEWVGQFEIRVLPPQL